MNRRGLNPITVCAAVLFYVALGCAGFSLLALLSPVELLLLVAAVTVASALAVLASRRQQERQRWALAGCCDQCGYDLRATRDRCPECGAPLPEELRRRRRIAAEIRAAAAGGTDPDRARRSRLLQ